MRIFIRCECCVLFLFTTLTIKKFNMFYKQWLSKSTEHSAFSRWLDFFFFCFFFGRSLRSVNLLFTLIHKMCSNLSVVQKFCPFVNLGHFDFPEWQEAGVPFTSGGGNGRVSPWCHLERRIIVLGNPSQFSWSRPNIDEWICPLGNEDTIGELPAGICILGGSWSQRPWIPKRSKWKIEMWVKFFCRL